MPLLRPGEDPADPVVLATWHEALSSALAPSVPHELFALWLYPVTGGSVLLGPEALAADHLAVPEPPLVTPQQLGLLAEIVRDAGYRSVSVAPIRYAGVDAGLMLFAAFAEQAHGPAERAAVEGAAAELGPAFVRLARRWRAEGPRRAELTAARSLEALASVAEATSGASSPRDLARGVSAGLADVLPHERLEILVPGSSHDQWYRLGEHPGGPLWGNPDLVVPRSAADLAALFASGDRILHTGALGEPVAIPVAAGAAAMRSVAGVRLAVAGRPVGCLLVGSSDAARYADDDLDLLASAGAVVAPRVDAFVTAGHLQVLRGQLTAQRGIPTRIARVLEVLATTVEPWEATRKLQSEAASLLAFDEMWFALKLGDELRVAMVGPGERRPLADLPQIALGDNPLGRVARGRAAGLVVDAEDRTDLIVPLRVGGRTIGALVLAALQPGMFKGADEDIARQLADAVAPHLELQRRAAVGLVPAAPGWKRTM